MALSPLQPSTTSEFGSPTATVPSSSLRRRLALTVRILRVRLRFVVVLLVAFFIVGKWHVIRNYWDKLTRPAANLDTTANAVSLDTEYFCPMDPGVVSDWSGKCGICNMTLVRRKKGDNVQLPEGVVARMQLSPYRIQLAGIETSPITYRPLVRELAAVGWVITAASSNETTAPVAIVEAEVYDKDLAIVAEGFAVEISGDAVSGQAPLAGKVRDVASQIARDSGTGRVRLEVDDPRKVLRSGMFVTVQIQVPAVEMEPFRSMPRVPPPIKPDNLREVFVCPEHPDVLRDKLGRCPLGKNDLERRQLQENQRLDWWCPMHPRVTANSPGAKCDECNGMTLLARVLTYSPVGEVLAVPETAVIDTGLKRVIYVERALGMFDGVEVTLGLRCGEFYPVIKGLEAGQRVATSGAFLIDAETRLNPSVAVGYFGAALKGKR